MRPRGAWLLFLGAAAVAAALAPAAKGAAPDPVEGSRLFVHKGCVT